VIELIVLYSTHCPKCNVLKKKLNEKHIEYMENNNKDEMLAKGFTEIPMLEINNKIMNFSESIKWIGEQ
jgi:glutaredoxin